MATPTKNRPFHVKLDNDWREELYKGAASVAAGNKAIAELEDKFTQVFDAMLTEYNAAPASNDWIELEGATYIVAARTTLFPGASGGTEIHLVVTRFFPAE